MLLLLLMITIQNIPIQGDTRQEFPYFSMDINIGGNKHKGSENPSKTAQAPFLKSILVTYDQTLLSKIDEHIWIEERYYLTKRIEDLVYLLDRTHFMIRF